MPECCIISYSEDGEKRKRQRDKSSRLIEIRLFCKFRAEQFRRVVINQG